MNGSFCIMQIRMSCIQCDLVVARGGVTVKLMKLKPLICTGSFQGPGVSRYSLSHLILYPFLKGGPNNCI